MNRTTKIILIIAGSLLIVCACTAGAALATGAWSVGRIAHWAENSTTRDLYQVADLLSEIAVITLPDGYSSPYGMHIGDITSVGFSSPSKNTHILLTQFPEDTSIDADRLLRQISRYSTDPESRWINTDMSVVEEKSVTISGQQSNLIISEGVSSEGTHYRSAVTVFQGKKGPTLLVIAGPIEEWDNQMVEDFIASIQ